MSNLFKCLSIRNDGKNEMVVEDFITPALLPRHMGTVKYMCKSPRLYHLEYSKNSKLLNKATIIPTKSQMPRIKP